MRHIVQVLDEEAGVTAYINENNPSTAACFPEAFFEKAWY